MIADLIRVRTASGNTAIFEPRAGTNDAALAWGIIEGREYDLPTVSGWAIDIGAHIGIVSVALALDNPDLRIVAVEALPENVEALRRNLALNGLTDRVIVEHAAAASAAETEPVEIVYGWTSAINQPDGFMQESKFIGGMVGPNDTSKVAVCSPLSLGAILAKHGIAEVSLLKIDCEGCEWFFLDSPELSRVNRIIGEMHIGRHGDAKRLRALLAGFTVTMDDSLVVATFEAVR